MLVEVHGKCNLCQISSHVKFTLPYSVLRVMFMGNWSKHVKVAWKNNFMVSLDVDDWTHVDIEKIVIHVVY